MSAELFAEIALRSHDSNDVKMAKMELSLASIVSIFDMIKIEAMLASASNDNKSRFEKLFTNARELDDIFDRAKACVLIATHSGDMDYLTHSSEIVSLLPKSEIKETLTKSLALVRLKTRDPDDAERFMKQFSDAEIQSVCVNILSKDRERLGKLLDRIYDPVVQIEAYVVLHTPNSAFLRDAKRRALGIGEFTLNAKALVIIARATKEKEDIQKAWKAVLELDKEINAVIQITLLADLGKVSHKAFEVAKKKAIEIKKEPCFKVKALLEIADRLAEIIK